MFSDAKETPMKVYEIPGKLNVEWHSDAKAIVDTWENYSVTLDEFKEAVMVKGVTFAKIRGVQAWIVDSSKAQGTFSPEIQAYIGSDVFAKFAEIGVKHFITITSEVSALTKMSVSSYAAKTGPFGLQLAELGSVSDAMQWLEQNCGAATA